MAIQFLINFSQVVHIFLTPPTLFHHHGDNLGYPIQQHVTKHTQISCINFFVGMCSSFCSKSWSKSIWPSCPEQWYQLICWCRIATNSSLKHDRLECSSDIKLPTAGLFTTAYIWLMLSNDNPLSACDREERTCNNISWIVTSSFTKLSSSLSTIPFSTLDLNFVPSLSSLASPLRSSSNGWSIFAVFSPSKFFRNYKKRPEVNSSAKNLKYIVNGERCNRLNFCRFHPIKFFTAKLLWGLTFKALKQCHYTKHAINIHRETFTVLLRTETLAQWIFPCYGTTTYFCLRFLLSHVYNLNVPITREGYTNHLQWLLITKLLLFWR